MSSPALSLEATTGLYTETQPPASVVWSGAGGIEKGGWTHLHEQMRRRAEAPRAD